MIDSSDVRKLNLNQIRSVMWRGGEHTKQSMALEIGLSSATCNTLLNEMEENCEVLSEKRQLNGVGRSTSVFRINEQYESILCVKVEINSDGHRELWIEVLSMLGNSLCHEKRAYEKLNAETIINRIIDFTVLYSNISIILVGISSIVDNGVIRLSDIPELENVPLESMIKEKTDIPIYLAYDCQYRVYGAYKKYKYETETLTLFYCMKNVLPGTASVSCGKILKGKNGFAGMTGYIPYGMSFDDQIKLIADGKGLNVISHAIASTIAVLNPDEIIFAGNVIDNKMMEDIFKECRRHFPDEFMPKFRLIDDEVDSFYLEGMYQLAIELKNTIEI